MAAAYRRYMYVSGGVSGKGAAFTAEEIEAVVKAGGKLPKAQLLRCRLRYMTRGAVIGTRAFVEKWGSKERKLMEISEESGEGLLSAEGLIALKSQQS